MSTLWLCLKFEHPLHILALVVVFEEKTIEDMKFYVAKSPTDEDVAVVMEGVIG